MTQNSITLKLTQQQETKLYETWKTEERKAPPYAKWQLKCENCIITCYESGKTLFQGKDAEVYASPFMSTKPQTKKTDTLTLPQAGSDEVGTGDYFGPVCVCACVVDQTSWPKLERLGIRDSKQLRDSDIRTIAPEIMKAVPYSLLILDNPTYNRVHETDNMNQIKARLHNKAYLNLNEKCGLPELIVVDQFTPEKSYYRYLSKEPAVVDHIHFETKAENSYPAVAAASIIARYAFLRKWDEMEKTYDMTFHKGGGKDADLSARQFVMKYGSDQLGKVAKLHFKNTERI